MSVRYIVKQMIGTVNKRFLEEVYSSPSERMSSFSYDEFIKNNPGDYFELIKDTHTEECLRFTKFED